MFEKIDMLIHLGINISFKKEFNGFKIILKYQDKKEIVLLPYNHLNEDKIIKYIVLLQDKILET